MAEPASSIVTLATVTLAIIKKTANFIQEAQVIDDTIEKLLLQLIDLRQVIKLVQSTCEEANEGEDHRASRFIKSALRRCQTQLEDVESLVKSLASRPSQIDEAITNTEKLCNMMHQGVSMWALQNTHEIKRQGSHAIPLPEAINVRADLQQYLEQRALEEEPVSPLSRANTTFSQTDTIYEPPTRRTSSVTHDSRSSVSSSSAQSRRSQSNRNDSVISGFNSPKPNSDWVEFHYQIKVCDGKEARIRDIRDALRQHADGSSLANSKDGSQRSPLHLAAQRGDVKLAQILLEFSADINAKDSQPCSVLDLAVAHNQDAFVEFLLQHDVDENAISKQNRFRFDEMKETIEMRRNKLEKSTRKDRKRIRGNSSAIPT